MTSSSASRSTSRRFERLPQYFPPMPEEGLEPPTRGFRIRPTPSAHREGVTSAVPRPLTLYTLLYRNISFCRRFPNAPDWIRTGDLRFRRDAVPALSPGEQVVSLPVPAPNCLTRLLSTSGSGRSQLLAGSQTLEAEELLVALLAGVVEDLFRLALLAAYAAIHDTTGSPTSRAKPISWVTTGIVTHGPRR
jgi:hypothetical protein